MISKQVVMSLSEYKIYNFRFDIIYVRMESNCYYIDAFVLK